VSRASTSAAALIAAAVLWTSAGVACAQAASAIPYKVASEGPAFDGPQWLFVVAACGAFLGVALYVLRRFGSRLPLAATTRKRVRVIERTSIAPHTQLVVVEYERRRLLLSVSAGATVCLRDSDATDATDATQATLPAGGAA
jgi:flagellar biogenesis protein FliO